VPRTRPRRGEPADHALGVSRGGFGTKVHLVWTARGLLLGVFLTAGQRQESRAFAPTMGAVLTARRRPRRWPKYVAGDKGYSFPGVRRWLRRRRIGPVIPTRSNQPREPDFDKKRYRRRNVVERVVGWYKERRALGTRYDKLAVNYRALWYVAMIENLLRRRLSDTT
jgi:transposase